MVRCEYCGRGGFTVLKSHYNACYYKKKHEAKMIKEKTAERCKKEFERQKKLEESIRKEEHSKNKQSQPSVVHYHIDNSVHNNITNNIININTQNKIAELDNDFTKFLENAKSLIPQMIENGVSKNQIPKLLIEAARNDSDESTKRMVEIIDAKEIDVPDSVNDNKIIDHVETNLQILEKELKSNFGIDLID